MDNALAAIFYACYSRLVVLFEKFRASANIVGVVGNLRNNKYGFCFSEQKGYRTENLHILCSLFFVVLFTTFVKRA
jgi:hypothetical protein